MCAIKKCLHCGDRLTEYLWCKHCGDQTLLDEYTGVHKEISYVDDQLDKADPHVMTTMYMLNKLSIRK